MPRRRWVGSELQACVLRGKLAYCSTAERLGHLLPAYTLRSSQVNPASTPLIHPVVQSDTAGATDLAGMMQNMQAEGGGGGGAAAPRFEKGDRVLVVEGAWGGGAWVVVLGVWWCGVREGSRQTS